MNHETAIIGDIYAAALDEQPWQEVIDKAVELFDATGAFFFTPFVSEADGGCAVFRGLADAEAKRFLSEVATVDVWYHELVRRHGSLRVGLQWQSDLLVSERELHRTRFFADYLRPCDVGRALGTLVGDGSSDRLPVTPMVLYRPVRSRPFSAADEAKLGLLQPHFTRAMAMRHRLREAAQGAAALALERVSTAVAVLAGSRRILCANSAAEKLFSNHSPSLVKDGRLCACEPAQRAALDKALLACSTYRFDDGLSLSVRLSGSPGHGVVARLAPPPASTPNNAKAAAIVFVSREGRSEVNLEAIMTALYKLTPKEAMLVKALSDGVTPENFAESRQVGLATVKTQLSAVFAKTGVRRQADLMRLAYSIAR